MGDWFGIAQQSEYYMSDQGKPLGHFLLTIKILLNYAVRCFYEN